MIAFVFCSWIIVGRPTIESVSSVALFVGVWQIANLFVAFYRAGAKQS